MNQDQGLTLGGGTFMLLGWGTILFFAIWCFSRVLALQRRQRTEVDATPGARAQWATRIGLILAMAGNAIGLGNFLRFPVKAAANGGGAFMVPYFLALLLLGLPIMWLEWTVGRYGGNRGHGSTPGMFQLMWNRPFAKYLGAFGIFLPLTIAIYYCFIESWTLAFAWFSGTGAYWGNTTREAMGHFLHGFQGTEANQFFTSASTAVVFFVITLACNYLFLVRGIAKGIEVLAKIGMPILFVFGIVLAVRVLTLGTPDAAHPDWNISNGIAYIWNPDYGRLGSAAVWLAAAGQIFFTLSLGQGMINTYASYVREKDDVTLNGLTTTTTNEFAEVILGGTIAIPVAVAFFGLAETQTIAREGTFNLGFQAMPVIFQQLPLGQVLGAMWFLLLFIAGITSSVALISPAVAFVEDEFNLRRAKAVNVVFGVVVLCAIAVVAFFKHGFLDEMDFWAGTFGLVAFAVIEVIVFGWVFGVERGWREMHKGADLKVPRLFKFVIKYVTPVYLLALLVAWTIQDAIPTLLMRGVESGDQPYLWGARALMVGLIVLTLVLIREAWRRPGGEWVGRRD
ncbi:MAG TPA: sodium-dependent transporter [Candidatus Krumholzibacteria bacterium]|nr:sodium-dependent transporter [Candidatus Krumholzibacteria bacterium]HPD71677.1 sodium-dependent transporter [Candidatus Krumholzibacteria bacterium]HRY41390.1 sodium-dependent transporter [Candidatus Krumholzibacteria bacterium]